MTTLDDRADTKRMHALVSFVGLVFSFASGSCTKSKVPAETYSIAGVVSGAASGGVALQLTGPKSASVATDSLGNYSFSGLANGSYTLTPSLAAFLFTPKTSTVNVNGANVTQNFTSATCQPTSCTSQPAACGPISDGCSGTLDCDAICPAGETCGGGGIPNFCGLSSTVDAATACAAIQTSSVQILTRCLGILADVAESFLSASSCTDVVAAVNGGSVQYDATQASACINTFTGLSCDSYSSMDDACGSVFTGTVAPGGACNDSVECAGQGSTCDERSGCPGSCIAAVGLNGDCSAVGCRAGLTCQSRSGTSTCQAPVPAGQSCTYAPCVSGTKCLSDGNGGLVCRTLPGPGQSCAQTLMCAAGCYCNSTQICSAKQTSGSCSNSGQCALPYWCVGSVGSETCQLLSVGAVCTPGQNQCGLGMYCGSNNTCVEWPHAGGDCGALASGEYADCLDSWCVITTGSQGVCQAYLTAGQSCTSSSQCVKGTVCSGSTGSQICVTTACY